MLKWIKSVFGRPVSTPRRQPRLGLELFEDRTVPSASPKVALSALTHTLTINGTAGADSVKTTEAGHQIKVNFNGHVYSYASNKVAQIDVDTGKGADKIVNDTALQVTVDEAKTSDVIATGIGPVVLLGGTTGSTTSSSTGSVLTAHLTGTTGASGEIFDFTDGTSVGVVVSGLSDDATYTVDIGTTSVGTFTTDSNGAGNIIIDNVTATIASGTAVSIVDSDGNTDLSGTFATPSLPPITAPTPLPPHGGSVLSASLTGTASGVTGQITALPTKTSGEENLQVVVSGLTASTTYTVEIGTTSVGTFNTDSTGAANVTLNDIAATIASGTAVSIVDSNGTTDLSGTFAAPTSPPMPTPAPWGGGLSASLTGTTSGVTGQITVLPTQTRGEDNLQVVVSGLTASTTYTVEIGTTSVGTFTTDSTGAANVTLSDITATIASGTAVSIVDSNGTTDLSGTFAASTLPFPPAPGGGGGCGGMMGTPVQI